MTLTKEEKLYYYFKGLVEKYQHSHERDQEYLNREMYGFITALELSGSNIMAEQCKTIFTDVVL